MLGGGYARGKRTDSLSRKRYAGLELLCGSCRRAKGTTSVMESKPLAMFEQHSQCRDGFICPLFPAKRLLRLDDGLLGFVSGRRGVCGSVERCFSLPPRLWGIELPARCNYLAAILYCIIVVRKLGSPLHQRLARDGKTRNQSRRRIGNRLCNGPQCSLYIVRAGNEIPRLGQPREVIREQCSRPFVRFIAPCMCCFRDSNHVACFGS